MTPDLQAKQKELEQKYATETVEVDKTAAALYKKSPKKAMAYLDGLFGESRRLYGKPVARTV